ncbi:alpha/beta fold hydrolase [Reyranella sp. CPCC 100927]|uniref:alpha/beta fold hydrolase n=1 Tax=Reyranella sp. CPCC 100927 TaxID=2599616 RepID=UPI001C49BB97|nr:alpha/beta hydrolase [Reyranella sp. CPCC 100927]
MSAYPARTSENLAALCAADGEFRLAARFWNGGMRLRLGETLLGVTLANGAPRAGDPGRQGAGVIDLAAPQEAWDALLAATPLRFVNDIAPLVMAGQMALEGDPVVYAQYYPAVMRAIELLRPPRSSGAVPPPVAAGRFDSPVGRYVHLQLGGADYRVYFEEAGAGIPLLLQHTAGCHGAQWRHLFERPEITDHFRLIAYDLPFHGKSLPPVGPQWWASEYRLTAAFLRTIPVTLASVLKLDRPVFMGCSVGGLLALDLARHHAEVFRAVISVEGALKVDADLEALSALWHPQVSNEYKARMMDSLMSPTSPEAYRKETSHVYAAGWPPAFLGDLHYYLADYDLRAEAANIDTGRTAVHILNGEYDWSGSIEHGQAAHAAIAGSTWAAMPGVGHFPMSENPDAFVRHLLPILETIKSR